MRSRVNLMAAGLVVVIVGMVGASFAAIPLYKVFCAATGYGGTPQIGPEASPGAVAIKVTVRFDADVNPNLPWRFAPDVNAVTVDLGQEKLASYSATSEASEPVTGVALYNVTPEKIGKYFHKTQCFCFNQQTLDPGQSARFPLTFWVDPAMATDPNTSDVKTITLSYTFFRTLADAARSGALAKAGPHVGSSSATASR